MDISNQLVGSLVNFATIHWLAVLFVVALIGVKVVADIKVAKRKKARSAWKNAVYNPREFRRQREK
jgi:hypothetical protein